MLKLDYEILITLNKKNNYKAILWLITHLALLLFFFSISINYLASGNYLLFIIFYLISGIVSSFTGLCGATHEFHHNTVFTNRNLNQFFYKFLCILNFINYEYNSISHKLHHKYNSHDENDSEKPIEKISYVDLIFNFTINFMIIRNRCEKLILNAIGIFPNSVTNNFLNNSPKKKNEVTKAARVIILYYLVTIIISSYFNFLYFYLLFIVLPFVMNFFVDMIARAQHYGLQKNSEDIFKTTRTIYLNKILTFLNWNMNYHLEHHLYPSVPFYNLRMLNNLVNNNKGGASKDSLFKFIKQLFRDNFLVIKK